MHSKPSKPKTVMVVDDSKFDLKIIPRIIQHTRLFEQTLTFQAAKEALTYLQENLKYPDKLPQLILLDIQMPEMNGFEFIEHYAKLPESFRQQCKVAILSSTDDASDIAVVAANPHLITLIKKPLHPENLFSLISEHFLNA